MSSIRYPRRGSLQYWPRKRASRQYSRIRSWKVKGTGLQAFAGYKVGMTHVQYLDTGKNSITKGDIISVPCTVLECPPISILSVRFYKKSYGGISSASEIRNTKLDKHVSRKVVFSKKKDSKLPSAVPQGTSEIRVCVVTHPSKTGIGKKKPEIFEVKLGGSLDDQLKFVNENFEKNINLMDVLKEGQFVDVHGVTKGKGFQGVIKKYGAHRKRAKSEKGTRRAVIGPEGRKRVHFSALRAGKIGYHFRTQYNGWLMKIVENPEFKPFKHYGIPRNPCVLIKGSVQGPPKRLITLTNPLRSQVESKPATDLVM